ncbi:MAG: hypothetical protein ACTHN8_10765 [Angustibacter sp.]
MNRYLVEAHAALDGGSERRADVESLLAQRDDVLPEPAPKVLGEDVADHLVLQFTIEADNEKSGDEKGRKIAHEVLDVGDVDGGDEHGLTLVSARAVDWEPKE